MNGKKIMLVEDNLQIMQGNQRLLKRRGYEVITALNLAEARIAIQEQMPDLFVLDIMLPDGSGLDFMAELRKYSQTPVLFLTGLTGTEDIVRGLTAGGDDYLTKPYDFGVLLARAEALLRRAQQVPEQIHLGHLCLDITADVATLDGIDLLLSQKEFALLLSFVQNEGRFLSGDYLYEKVWKQPMAGNSNTLKTTITRLREKIRDWGYRIEWSRGEGYCLERE